MKFLLCCLALCGALAAQTTTRPESAPTSRPLAILVRETAQFNALRSAHVLASGKRTERLHALIKERREAFGDVMRERLDAEAARISAEHERNLPAATKAFDDFARVKAEFLAYGAEDVRKWMRTHGSSIPDLPHWKYIDAASIDVVYEQLGDWIGFRSSVAVYSYVGPWDDLPAAVRIGWRGVDAFGDPIPNSDFTSEVVIEPDMHHTTMAYFGTVVTSMKIEQPNAESATPARGVVKVSAVRGRSAPR